MISSLGQTLHQKTAPRSWRAQHGTEPCPPPVSLLTEDSVLRLVMVCGNQWKALPSCAQLCELEGEEKEKEPAPPLFRVPAPPAIQEDGLRWV